MKETAETEKILIVDSDTDYMNRLSKVLAYFEHKGNKLEVLSSANEEEMQMQLMKNPDIKLVLIDDSTECLEHVLNRVKKYPKMQILIVSEQPGKISGQDQEFVHKSDTDKIKDCIVARLDDYSKIKKDSETLKPLPRRDIEYLMGKGKVISEVLDQVEEYALINKPILLEGETGTGKELIMDYLRRLSGRKKLITVNCGVMSNELAAGELFGSVKGAFTDAQNTKGKVGASEGGILFLDEINSLSLDIQVKLLRLMEYGTYTKVGDTVEYKANVRIIAAGNEPFEELVTKGRFRQDLYERFIDVIYVPALRERIEDIDYFIDRFLSENGKELHKNVTVSGEARKLLIDHDWTGNVRQLKNFIEKLVTQVKPDKSSNEYIIQPQLVQGLFNKLRQKKTDDIPKTDIPKDDYTLQSAIERAIRKALNKTGGHNGKAIKLLGIAHGTFYNLKKKYGIE